MITNNNYLPNNLNIYLPSNNQPFDQNVKRLLTKQKIHIVLIIIIKQFRDEFMNLDIPYKYRDYCQDDYADYISCVRLHPKALSNN